MKRKPEVACIYLFFFCSPNFVIMQTPRPEAKFCAVLPFLEHEIERGNGSERGRRQRVGYSGRGRPVPNSTEGKEGD